MSDHVVVKDDEPAVIYRYTRDEPGAVIPGVAARDLTLYDLASYSPEQRFALSVEGTKKDGAYKKVGTVPKALAVGAEPAAPSGEKDS